MKNNTWYLFKKTADIATYAKCKCGFEYKCTKAPFVDDVVSNLLIYPYCPMCGRKKKYFEGIDSNKNTKSKKE